MEILKRLCVISNGILTFGIFCLIILFFICGDIIISGSDKAEKTAKKVLWIGVGVYLLVALYRVVAYVIWGL